MTYALNGKENCRKRGPAKSGTIKGSILLIFLTNREPKVGVPAEGRRAHFWLSICQKPKQNLCFYGPRFCWDPFLTTFWALFDHFLGMSFGKAQNHSRTTFWPFLLLGPLRGHRPYKLRLSLPVRTWDLKKPEKSTSEVPFIMPTMSP